MVDRPFRRAFVWLFGIRLLGTVSVRYSYPFLPTIAEGLDVGIATVGAGIAVGELAGLSAPLFGRRLDRLGRRRGMLDGLAVAAVGCLGVAMAPNVVGFGAGLLLVALGRYLYDVSFNAWIGDEVPFERRGRVSGLGELAWSGAFLIGVPLAGLLTAATSWRAPFLASAVLLVAAIPVVARTLPPTVDEDVAGTSTGAPLALRIVPLHVAILWLAFGAALLFASEGAWFEADLGLDERAVSAVVVGLGIGEVIGALASAALADRIGKRVAVLVGLAGIIPAAALFALADGSATVGIAAAVLLGLGFEVAFVSALPLVVEIDPARRAGVLTVAVAALTAGRTVAAVAGTRLFDAHGIDAVVLVAVPALAISLVVVAAAVREPAVVVSRPA